MKDTEETITKFLAIPLPVAAAFYLDVLCKERRDAIKLVNALVIKARAIKLQVYNHKQKPQLHQQLLLQLNQLLQLMEG